MEVRLDIGILKSAGCFKYHESTIAADGSEEMEIIKSNHAGLRNWRDVFKIFCDRRKRKCSKR